MEAALITFLRNQPTVTSIAGNRIESIVAAEGLAYPLVVFSRTRTEYVTTKDGPTGDVKASIEIRTIAESQATMHELTKAVRKALNGYRGTIGTYDGCHAVCTDDKSGYDADMKLYVGMLDFTVWYTEV